MDRQRIEDAAHHLRRALEDGAPVTPVRTLLAGASMDDAYAVQELNTELALTAGSHLAGWKIGLTSAAVQQQLGVDQPDLGALLAEWCVIDGGKVEVGRLLQPKVEAEVAFVLERDLPDRDVTSADIRGATAFVVPAIEIVDSRIANWDINIIDTVADNASSGMYVLGERRTPVDGVDLREIRMTLSVDGQEVSSGSGAACLGDPVTAVVWLANTLAGVGRRLRAGQVILSGALGPMVTATAGATYHASFDGLGTVGVAFEERG